MALDRTAGFDMLIQISENELNLQVATAFASGLLFPASMSTQINAFGISGTLDLNFRTPVVDLDRPRPQIGLTVPFSESQLQITNPIPMTIAPLGGNIVIVDAVQMRNTPGNQQAVLDFTAGAPAVIATFDAPTVALLTPILASLGVTITQAQNQVAGIVQARLVADLQRLPLTPPIPVDNDSDPLTPFNFDVTTVNDTSAADRDVLVFGVRTSSESGGNINNVTQSFLQGSSGSLVMMSNFWLLARVIRPQLASALKRPISDFDTPLRLNHAVPVSGQDATLTKLEARVIGDRIRVDGEATASGTGWSAVAVFHFFISLQLSGGQIQITATEPIIDTDVDLEWWVWLLGLGLGGLFGGVVGGVVAAIVLAILEAVAEGMVDKLAIDAFDNAADSIPPIPLGPVGAGLTLTEIILDDLELRGPIVRSLGLPVKSSGSHSSSSGFTVDLDSGQVRAAGDVRSGTDLIWDAEQGLDTHIGSGLTVSGASFGSLTPVDLEKMAFAGHHLGVNSIPLSVDLPLVGVHSEVVFGVLTSEGRLAKVRAWRAELEDNKMHMHWTTYDRPAPALDITVRWDVLKEGEGTPSLNKDFAPCNTFEVSRRCTIEAWPRLVSFPVDYQWCLCGTVLTEGMGEVEAPSGPIAYELSGRYLVLTTTMGQAVDCELCVSAIDARQRELFTCVPLQVGKTETRCGAPKRFIPKLDLEIILCDPLDGIDIYAPVLSDRVKGLLRKALDAKEVTGEKTPG